MPVPENNLAALKSYWLIIHPINKDYSPWWLKIWRTLQQRCETLTFGKKIFLIFLTRKIEELNFAMVYVLQQKHLTLGLPITSPLNVEEHAEVSEYPNLPTSGHIFRETTSIKLGKATIMSCFNKQQSSFWEISNGSAKVNQSWKRVNISRWTVATRSLWPIMKIQKFYWSWSQSELVNLRTKLAWK